MNNGWIILHKKILDTSFYKDTDSFYLAVHILLKASWKEAVFLARNSEVILHRGQYLGGYKRLAKELEWGKSRVRRSLRKLVEANFVHHYFNNLYSIITVVNYNNYQDPSVQIEPPAPSGVLSMDPLECSPQTPLSAQAGPHNKEVKEVKETNTLSMCESLWNFYPKKLGKKDAMRHLKATIKTEDDYKDCLSAITNYKNSSTVGRGFVQYGSTWFNSWKEWVDDPDPGEDPEIAKLKESLE